MNPFERAKRAADAAGVSQVLDAHASGKLLDTRTVLTRALHMIHPNQHLTATSAAEINLLGFAEAGLATADLIDPDNKLSTWGVQGARRVQRFPFPILPLDGDAPESKKGGPTIVERVQYGAFHYEWDEKLFTVYAVEGMKEGECSPSVTNYIICEGPAGQRYNCAINGCKAHALMKAVAEWSMQTSKVVMVFDGGRWRADAELWNVTQAANWDKVVLTEEKKTGLRDDVEGFFDSEDLYKSFAVPWKRGTIFHGPPGNGKTLCIQSLIKTLSDRPDSVPTLYVKSFDGRNGPQWSISQIFSRARATAPCLLVLEDIDSMVTDKLRSYFLNEVDGLESNNGIYMLGTTNHLDRLDPALANRPSRFDRKVKFEVPSKQERVDYAKQWRNKVPSMGDGDFSDELCSAVADVTDGFSFAYLKELFLATLLGIAREKSANGKDPSSTQAPVAIDQGGSELTEDSPAGLESTILWPRIKAQVEILRAAMKSAETKQETKRNGHGGHAATESDTDDD